MRGLSTFCSIGLLRLSAAPAEFGAFVREESARWGKVVRAANVSLD